MAWPPKSDKASRKADPDSAVSWLLGGVNTALPLATFKRAARASIVRFQQPPIKDVSVSRGRFSQCEPVFVGGAIDGVVGTTWSVGTRGNIERRTAVGTIFLRAAILEHRFGGVGHGSYRAAGAFEPSRGRGQRLIYSGRQENLSPIIFTKID